MGNSGAVFDLDGTLIPNKSAERTFFFYMVRSKTLTPLNIFQMAAAVWSARGDWHAMTRGNKKYLRNKRVSQLLHVAHDFFEQRIDSMIFPEMRQVVEQHRAKGDIVLLLTGTLDVIADCFVRRLRMHGARSATLQVKDGRFTGSIEGILPYGMGKLEVLQDLRRGYNLDLAQTTLYANIYSDRYVMNAVEHAVAVNPDRRLRSYARRRGWKVFDPSKH